MKKILKVTGITVLSLIALVAIVVAVAAYVVFTPERITPIVVSQANKYIKGEVSLESLDLGLSFPDFGVEIRNLRVVGRPTAADTAAGCLGGGARPVLARVERCFLAIDVREFYEHNNVVVQGVELTGVDLDARIDTGGTANFDVLNFDTTPTPPDTSTGGLFFNRAELKFFRLRNANIAFADYRQGMNVCVKNLHLDVDGTYESESGQAEAKVGADEVLFAVQGMSGAVKPLVLSLDASAKDAVYAADVDVSASLSSLTKSDTALARNVALALNVALSFNHRSGHLALQKADVKVNDISFATSGEVNTDTAFSAFDMNLAYTLNVPSLAELVAMVPVSMVPEAAKIQASGNVALSGKVEGVMRDSTLLPYVSGDLSVGVADARYTALPYLLDKLSAQVGFGVDLSAKPVKPSFASITKLSASAMGASVAASGRVSELLGDPLLNIKLKADVPDLNRTVGALNLKDMLVKGSANANISARLHVSDAVHQRIERIMANGSIGMSNLYYAMPSDTISASIGKASVLFGTNRATRMLSADGLNVLDLNLTWQGLRAQVGGNLRAMSRSGKISARTSNPLVASSLPKMDCRFNLGGTTVRTDSIRLRLALAKGSAQVRPSSANPKLPKLALQLATDSLRAVAFGNVLSLASGITKASAEQVADTTQGFGGWLAKLNVDYNDTRIFSPQYPEMIYLDTLKADISDKEQRIAQCRVRIGRSDFELSGDVQDLLPYLSKKKTLTAKLQLSGNNVDVNQLMQIADAGNKPVVPVAVDVESSDSYVATVKSTVKIDTAPPAYGAIMLPNDLNVEFATNIKAATFQRFDLENINGSVTLADGAVILRELGVTAQKKSRMKLTAIYRTPERNHIYAGVDFHLMDVELGDLQYLIDEVDSVLPMLRAFEGKVDFHLAAQTYLDSLYNLKFSTLRGMASIHGEELVLLDNEMFKTISKYLMFKNKKRNIIDSMDVEVIAFKRDVEIYPFLISMDRYKVAVGGKHKLNMNVNYHVDLLSSPIPKRFGVDIKGNMDDVMAHPLSHIKLTEPRYEATFMPGKKNVTQSMEEDIRNQIRTSLRKAAE